MKKIDYEKQFLNLAKKTAELVKGVDEDLIRVSDGLEKNNQIQDKWVKLDRAKWTTMYRDYREILKRNFKITDNFCIQVADNKILRSEIAFLTKELKNYVPEHTLFQENNTATTEEEDVEEDTSDHQEQLELDFGKACFDDTKH